MPRGKPSHCYQVKIGDSIYHNGDRKRAAEHAFRGAQRGNKGMPAPSAGKLLVFMLDGRTLCGVFANGTKFML